MEQKSNSSKSSIFKSQLVTGDKSQSYYGGVGMCVDL